MVLRKNKSHGEKSRFLSCDTSNSNRKKENISSDDSEFGSVVSFGWKKVRTNSDTEKDINLENMASGSDSDNSDDSSNGELNEHNAADDSENENEIKIEKRNSQSEESDVDNTSSEEETHRSGNTKGDVTINNSGVTEEPSDTDDPESNDNEQQESLKVPDNYAPFQMTGGLMLEHISDDDEVWMMQCPVFISPEDLKGKDLMFGGTSEFAIKQNSEEQLYETASYTDMNKSVSCLLPSRNSRHLVAKVIEPAGLIVIKEKICIPDFDDDPVPKERNFSIPKDLKIRHPLFGSGYEEALDARKTQVEDSVKKKKKKHKTKDKSDTIHKRKKEMSDDETECTSANKRQKIEAEEEELSAEASEECDMENSIKHKKKKKKKSKSRDFENQNLNNDESISKKKKKKSKNKETENFITEEVIVKEEIEQEVESEENLPKKKKKHKKKSRQVLDAATE